MSDKNNQITDIYTFNPNNLIFSDKIECKIPNSPLKYNRIHISTKNPDGTIGDLLIETEELFSFGVNENRDTKTQELTGYSLALCLYSNASDPTEKEKAWKEAFETRIVAPIVDWLLKNKKELKFFDLERLHLKKINPIYVQKDKETGEAVSGKSPVLSPKLVENKKRGTIESAFYDHEGNTINPLTLIKKNCRATTVIKIESIYNSSDKFSLQYKVYESEVKIVDRAIVPLRKRKPVLLESGSEENGGGSKVNSPPAIARKGSIEDDDVVGTTTSTTTSTEKEVVPKDAEKDTEKVRRKVKKAKKTEE
jgi:hypothetical protein